MSREQRFSSGMQILGAKAILIEVHKSCSAGGWAEMERNVGKNLGKLGGQLPIDAGNNTSSQAQTVGSKGCKSYCPTERKCAIWMKVARNMPDGQKIGKSRHRI